MSKRDAEKEIEEAHRHVREGRNNSEKKVEQKRHSSEESPENPAEKTSGKSKKKATKEELEKLEKTTELAEESGLEELPDEVSEKKPKEGVDLEEITRKGTALPAEVYDSPYVEQLSHKPMGEIYQEVKDIYKIVEDKGYISPLNQRQIEYFNAAVQKKFQDEEQGTYSFSEEAARAASVTQQLSASLVGSYKGKKSTAIMEQYRT